MEIKSSTSSTKSAHFTDLRTKVWNLRSYYHEMKKKTIEFRQHESTFDVSQIENWIKVCIGLVAFSMRVNSEDLAAFLRSVIENGEFVNEEYMVEKLLHHIGLPEQAEFYGARRRPSPIS